MAALGMDQEQIDFSARCPARFRAIAKCRKAMKPRTNAESDPLCMEWQFDGTEEAEAKWRDKVTEIKARFPLS